MVHHGSWTDTVKLVSFQTSCAERWQATEKPDLFRLRVLNVDKQQKKSVVEGDDASLRRATPLQKYRGQDFCVFAYNVIVEVFVDIGRI